MTIRLGWLLTLLIVACWATCAGAAGQDLDLVNATLIDGTGAPARSGVAVIVRNGRISAIADRTPAPTHGVRRIDLQGRYLLPGFIDAHAHIESPAAALRALQSGVTTARVLGDTHLQGLGTRDLIKAGHIPGPELWAAGGHIRHKPGEALLLSFPQFGDALNGELSGPDRITAVVRALLDRGADVIKVHATERMGLATTDPRRADLTEAEMRAAVVEAAKDGRYVAAHAHGREGAAAAVRAGVRSIEHGTYIDDATLAEMKRRGIFLVPTLAAMSPLGDEQTTEAGDIALQLRTQEMMAPLRAVVHKARRLGITVAASTDGRYDEGTASSRIRIPHDIALLREAGGFTPLESITAATVNGARLIGIESRTGAVLAGLEADLIVVERDPLADVTALFEPLLVVTDGRIAVERPF